MLIKQFCQATGLPRDTVRFYVRRGLLTPTIGSRVGNRYQVFDETHVERAKLIKAAQCLGFSLRQIADLAQIYESEVSGLSEKAGVLRAQLHQITTREHQLGQMRKYLKAKLDWIEGGANSPQPVFHLGSRPIKSLALEGIG